MFLIFSFNNIASIGACPELLNENNEELLKFETLKISFKKNI